MKNLLVFYEEVIKLAHFCHLLLYIFQNVSDILGESNLVVKLSKYGRKNSLYCKRSPY